MEEENLYREGSDVRIVCEGQATFWDRTGVEGATREGFLMEEAFDRVLKKKQLLGQARE